MHRSKQLKNYIRKGERHKQWYAKANHTIASLFPAEDTDKLCEMLAVTSMNATLKANVSLFIKALYQYKNDLPFDGFLPAVIDHLNKVRNNEKLTGRKVRNFAEALKGNPNAVVVDLWMQRAFGFPTDSPTKKQYDFIERYIKRFAPKHNMKPVEMQASIWMGIRGIDRQVGYKDILHSKFKNDMFTTERNYLPNKILV